MRGWMGKCGTSSMRLPRPACGYQCSMSLTTCSISLRTAGARRSAFQLGNGEGAVLEEVLVSAHATCEPQQRAKMPGVRHEVLRSMCRVTNTTSLPLQVQSCVARARHIPVV
jgi:hypothetical protein